MSKLRGLEASVLINAGAFIRSFRVYSWTVPEDEDYRNFVRTAYRQYGIAHPAACSFLPAYYADVLSGYEEANLKGDRIPDT